MTVAELIEKLKTMPQDVGVYCACYMEETVAVSDVSVLDSRDDDAPAGAVKISGP